MLLVGSHPRRRLVADYGILIENGKRNFFHIGKRMIFRSDYHKLLSTEWKKFKILIVKVAAEADVNLPVLTFSAIAGV